MLPLKSLFAAAVLLAVTAEARAASVQLDYSREGAPRCPDEQAFKDVVAARLGSDPFVQRSPTRLVVTLARAGQSFEGRAELRDGQEVRWTEPTVPLRDCVQVVRALGLAVAVRLRELPADTQSITRAPSPEAPPVRTEGPPVRTEPPPVRIMVGPPPAADRRTSAPRAHSSPSGRNWRLGIDAGLALGSVPGDVSAEIAASGGYRWGAFSFSGELRWTTPRTSAQAHGTRLALAAVPCAHFRIKTSPEFFGCAVVQGGPLFGSALGGLGGDLVLPYFGLGPRLGLDIPIMPPRLALRFAGDAIVSVVRPQFALDRRVVWATSIITGMAGAGLVVSL